MGLILPSISPQGSAVIATSGSECLSYHDEEDMRELAMLRRNCERTHRKAEIQRLRAERARGYVDEADLPNAKRKRVDKDQIAIERAKETRRPDVYSGESQKALDLYDWETLDKAIKADPTRSYSWKVFIGILQENLLPKEQCDIKLAFLFKGLKQKSNQSAAEFFAYCHGVVSRP